jgi:hypothetical protein
VLKNEEALVIERIRVEQRQHQRDHHHKLKDREEIIFAEAPHKGVHSELEGQNESNENRSTNREEPLLLIHQSAKDERDKDTDFRCDSSVTTSGVAQGPHHRQGYRSNRCPQIEKRRIPVSPQRP